MAQAAWNRATWNKVRWLVLVAPLAWACSDDLGPAVVEQRSALSDETQVSELVGFSLEQVVPAGAQVATLTWNQGRSGIDFSPASATTQLRWSLQLPERGSEAFRIEQVEVECTNRFITNDPRPCAHRLEADLLLHLASDDGALAEDIAVTLDARSPSDVGWLNRELDLQQLGGNFTISASEGLPATLRVGVYGSVSDGELVGSLIGDVLLEYSKKDGVELSQGAVVTVAEWRGRPVFPD